MSKFKRILTIGLAAFVLLAVLSVSAFAAQTKFTDVSEKDETLTKAVSLLEGLGVTKGTSETTFGTNEAVTRQQMAAFVYRLLKAGKSLEGGENTSPFVDLYDDTYYGMVSWASDMGIIKGISDTEFDPDGGIILQDAYTMLVRALGYEKSGPLGYPFDYIDIAEQSDVDLGDGLPSSVSYEKELTRGNVAILLYNTFYAKTGVAETVEKERLIGQGNNKKYVLEVTEEYPRLCEKVYDVVEEEFVVVETTHYAFNESKDSSAHKPTEDSAGEGTMLLLATEDDQKIGSFYATVAELGFAESADSYIMSHVNVFYTYDEDKDKVDTVLYAEPLMQKATANSATYGSVTADRVKGDGEHFYAAGTAEWSRMDGSMVVAGKTLYFFDAPYSFVKPSYNGCTTDEDKYAVRNQDDTLLIDLICTDIDKGLYSYYVRDERFGSADGYNTALDKKLATTFHQVRTSGIYSMDIFDPDGDGRYEYMWYKPASFGKIDMDDDYDFVDFSEYAANKPVIETPSKIVENGLTKMPVIYANGATIDGVSGLTYRDGDFVAAYLNGEANYIYIFGSATAKQGVITKVSKPTGTVTIGTQSFRTCFQFRFFENFFQSDNISVTANAGSADTGMFSYLVSSAALNSEVILYIYNHNHNNVVYYEIVKGGTSTYSGENLLVPLAIETERNQNEKTLKYDQYLKVWVDGTEKFVPVDVETCYPEPTKTVNGTYRFDNTVTEEDGKSYDVYFGKLCTYSVDSAGKYTIHSLLHGRDEDGDADHLDLTFDTADFFDEKTTTQVAGDLAVDGAREAVTLRKITSSRYALEDAYGNSMVGTNGTTAATQYWFNDGVVLTDDSTIIIRTITYDDDGEEENEFTIYKGKSFPGTTESQLYNVQYIYENNGTNKSRVNLVLLYGEVVGDLEFTTTAKSDWRIVKSSTPYKVSDDEFRYSYEVYNPATGKLDGAVLGTVSKANASSLASAEPLPAGAVVKMTTAGYLDDKNAPESILDAQTNTNLAFITDVDLEERYLELVPVNAEDEEYFTVNDETFVLYELDDNVAITVLTLEEIDDISSAEISVLSLEDLAAAKKEILAYNSKIPDKNDKLTTKYGDNVKAYVTYTKKSSAEYPVIDTIVVIVNPDEPEEYLDLK